MDRRLFLIDAYAIIYRAYYALLRANFYAAGFNTGAVYGFCNTLEEVLRKEKPTHIAVCFDPPHGDTFRHKEYADYKAQREKQPEDITQAIPYIKRILQAYHIPAIEVAGYEADDVIGTLAHRAAREGYDTYMMTPDKDYGQLVAPHIYMYRPALKGEGFEIRDVAKVCEMYGIDSPHQVIDLLALEGDVSDNIPGCPGIGKVTAAKLIKEFGSVENLIENADTLKGKLREKIIDNAGQIRQSKWLATICTDVPIDIDINSLTRQPLDTEALAKVYGELQFKQKLASLKASAVAKDAVKKAGNALAASSPSPADATGMASLFDAPGAGAADNVDAPAADTPVEDIAPANYSVITTPDEVSALIARAAKQKKIGIAAYAPGAETMETRLHALAISLGESEGVLVPWPDNDNERERYGAIIAPLFMTDGPELVSFDIKRLLLLMRLEKITVSNKCFDTTVADYVIDPEKSHSPASVTERWLSLRLRGVDPDAKAAHPKSPLGQAEAMARYCEEADVALRLSPVLEAKVAEREMTRLLLDVEFPLLKVLADMEWTGVRIDPVALADMAARLQERADALENEAYRLAGGTFNISSPTQVGIVLFDRLAIDPKAKRTARGAYSTTEQVLEKYAARVPLVEIILKIRRLRKLISTYLEALPHLVNPRDGKIHTTYNQTVTATGRISSTNPNLQNIPIRTDDGREIRRAFIPDPGCMILSADYSQIELRLIADLANDRTMIDAFLSGDDIHRITASKVYGVPLDQVTDDQRRHAKTANFGIIYGISAFGLSERLGIPRAESKKLIEGYFATYPHIRAYLTRVVEEARRDGYVTTRMGRRRYLPDINSRNAAVRGYAERNAVNAPVQGTAADIIKVAMVRIASEIERQGLRSRMIMQVHDELIFNVVAGEEERLTALVKKGMEEAYQGAVPLEVTAGIASNWLEAH